MTTHGNRSLSGARGAQVVGDVGRQLALAAVQPGAVVDRAHQDVELTRLGHQLEHAREDDPVVVDRPAVGGVADVREVGELGLDPGGEIVGEELERDAGLLGLVGEVLALAARVGHGADAPAARGLDPREHLEVLDPLAEVVDPDRVVVAQHRRERAIGADQRAGVGECGLGAEIRRADLQDDRGLAGLGQQPQRLLEGRGAADALDEQAHHPGCVVLREVGDEVGDVGDRLVAGRDHGAEADPRAERDQDLADRARVGQRRDRAADELGVQAADPGRRETGGRDAHAVGAEHRDAGGRDLRADPLAHSRPLGAGLVTEPRRDDGLDAVDAQHVVDRGLDASVADPHDHHLGHGRAIADARVAAHSAGLVAGRVDAVERHPVDRHVLGDAARGAVGDAVDGDRFRVEDPVERGVDEGAGGAHALRSPCSTKNRPLSPEEK